MDNSHRDQVRRLYLELLGREADQEGLEYWCSVMAASGLAAVRAGIKSSIESRNSGDAAAPLKFVGYKEGELAIFNEFIDRSATAEPGFVVDFLGGRTRTTSLWKAAKVLDGKLTGLPIPGDYHADAVEWIGVLKAVRSSSNRFAAMELGAGFGPWIVASANAARRLGITDIRLLAVEADPQHYRMLKTHLADNGYDPEEHSLLEGAVGVSDGRARWPVVAESNEDWGSRPIFELGTKVGQDYLGRSFRQFTDIEVFGIADLIRREERWDLVHIDVQGLEVDLCKSALPQLQERVRWLVIGTHSRLIDGQLLDLLFHAGWVLENEKACEFAFRTTAPTLEAMTTCDGLQVWRNKCTT